ncbi:hypothetical protein MNBD_ALPHA08-777 [hydrothermal vent metagenome]|uniref:Type 1 capsular polysaccharide biosynthesis protein J n=1 Tax=hydrothermal vent metagenome TaxID=652676 RepID=A0A3B0S9K2_9ZZZZ
MSALINRLFVQHPQTVDETYFQHMRFAGWFATKLLAAGLAALVHAIIPAAFEKTAGNIIRELHHRMENRH